MLAFLLVLTAVASEPPWDTLASETGWSQVATRATDVGEVVVSHRKVGDVHCLQGVVGTALTPAQVLDVARDIDGTLKWSKAGLAASKVLKLGSGWIEFYQHLDIPDWTLVTDRWWVLRGRYEVLPGEARRFRWTRVDAATSYPDLHRQLEQSGVALEVPVNYGEWSLAPKDGSIEVSYRVCTDVGGSVPAWLQKVAAQRTLPDTVADVLREAGRRAGR